MRVVVATVLVALCWAATASADTQPVPVGFKLSPRLSAPASFVAKKHVDVYCAPTQAAIDATVGPEATDVQGATFIGGDNTFLSPLTCAFLNAWLNGRKPKNLYGVAGSLLTIAHEAELANGVADETDADCAALHDMVPMIRRFFPLRKRITMHNLMGLAWQGHYDKDPAYNAHPC